MNGDTGNILTMCNAKVENYFNTSCKDFNDFEEFELFVRSIFNGTKKGGIATNDQDKLAKFESTLEQVLNVCKKLPELNLDKFTKDKISEKTIANVTFYVSAIGTGKNLTDEKLKKLFKITLELFIRFEVEGQKINPLDSSIPTALEYALELPADIKQSLNELFLGIIDEPFENKELEKKLKFYKKIHPGMLSGTNTEKIFLQQAFNPSVSSSSFCILLSFLNNTTFFLMHSSFPKEFFKKENLRQKFQDIQILIDNGWEDYPDLLKVFLFANFKKDDLIKMVPILPKIQSVFDKFVSTAIDSATVNGKKLVYAYTEARRYFIACSCDQTTISWALDELKHVFEQNFPPHVDHIFLDEKDNIISSDPDTYEHYFVPRPKCSFFTRVASFPEESDELTKTQWEQQNEKYKKLDYKWPLQMPFPFPFSPSAVVPTQQNGVKTLPVFSELTDITEENDVLPMLMQLNNAKPEQTLLCSAAQNPHDEGEESADANDANFVAMQNLSNLFDFFLQNYPQDTLFTKRNTRNLEDFFGFLNQRFDTINQEHYENFLREIIGIMNNQNLTEAETRAKLVRTTTVFFENTNPYADMFLLKELIVRFVDWIMDRFKKLSLRQTIERIKENTSEIEDADLIPILDEPKSPQFAIKPPQK